MVRAAVHYAKQSRITSLAGEFSGTGTGIKGAEQERLKQATDKRIKRRVYFYLPVAGGIPQPEIGLGAHVYTADLSNLYDPNLSDPMVRGQGNDFESSVLNAGYRGYINREQGTLVVLNEDVPVAYVGTADKHVVIKRTIERSVPRVVTRREGDELVRRPNATEMVQLIRAAPELATAAPSFKRQYGEARVQAAESTAADQVLRAIKVGDE